MVLGSQSLLLLLGTSVLGNNIVEKSVATSSNRQGKVFSLFNVVQFKNEPCPTSSNIGSGNGGTRNGTCYTSNECSAKGGIVAGNCAAGFGVCCLFVLSDGGSTSQNCSYLRNPNYPSALVANDATGFQYTIHKCSCNVCYLRLDFISFTIQGLADTLELMGGMCLDSLQVEASSSEPIPEICGHNSGQHIYVDMGGSCSGNAQLAFSFTGDSNIRQWEIKATQVECGSRSAPPDGCLQYHTDLDGRLTTFNFDAGDDVHLKDQDYSICIRQEAGYCCVEYSVCSDAMDKGMTLSYGDMSTSMKAFTDSNCATMDYIGIPGSAGSCSGTGPNTFHSKYCGGKLNTFHESELNIPICDCSAPFEVRIFTNSDPELVDGNDFQSRGLCLEYTQIPCRT